MPATRRPSWPRPRSCWPPRSTSRERWSASPPAAVPQIADWCAVDVLDPAGRPRSVALAHVDPGRTAIVEELRERYPPEPDEPSGVPQVVRSGVSELHADIAPAMLAQTARDDRHLELLLALEMTSAICVPMAAGDRIIGAITFATSGGRRLTEADRALAEELGRRAGVAVEHARIHRERSHVAATLQRSLLPPRLPVVPGAHARRAVPRGGRGQPGRGRLLRPVPGRRRLDRGHRRRHGQGARRGGDHLAGALHDPHRGGLRARPGAGSSAGSTRRCSPTSEHRQMCTAACLKVMPRGDGRPIGVRLVCAGHPPPLPAAAGGATCGRPAARGRCSARSPRRGGGAAEFELAPGDSVVLYTDGVTDARGETGRFGQEQLEERAARGPGRRRRGDRRRRGGARCWRSRAGRSATTWRCWCCAPPKHRNLRSLRARRSRRLDPRARARV